MAEYATEWYVDNSILKHEKEASIRIKDLEEKQQTLRHASDNRNQTAISKLDNKIDNISEKVNSNKSDLTLFKNSQDNMEEHLKQWLSDTYATKWEYNMLNEKQKFIIKIIYYVWGLSSTAFIAFVTYVFNNSKI